MWAGTIPQNRPRSIRRGAARPAARIASESSEARSGWIEREARARPPPKTGHRHGPRRREGQRTLPRAKIPGIRFLRRAPHPCRSEAAGAGRDGSAARAGHLAAGGATGHESSPRAVPVPREKEPGGAAVRGRAEAEESNRRSGREGAPEWWEEREKARRSSSFLFLLFLAAVFFL